MSRSLAVILVVLLLLVGGAVLIFSVGIEAPSISDGESARHAAENVDEPDGGERVTPVEPPTPVAEDVAPERAVVGLVLGAEGTPLVGALVRALDDDNHAFLEATTGDDGRYVLGPLESKSLIEAAAAGHFTRRSTAGPGESRDFQLGEPGELRGVVTYEDGKPVEGANLRVHAGNWMRRASEFDATTAADGSYSFATLEPGSYTLRVLAARSPMKTVRNLTVVAGESRTVDVEIERGVALRGTIVARETGSPIAGALVEGRDAFHLKARSDDRGRYELIGVGRAGLRVAVTAKGFRRLEQWVPGSPRGGDVERDFDLQIGAMVRGRVVSEEGEPIAGALVSRQIQRARRGPAQPGLSATTDEEGRFEVDGLRTDRSRTMWAVAPGYVAAASQPFELRVGEELDVGDIVLPRGGGIAGRLIDDAGAPITEQAWVSIVTTRRRPELSGINARPDADGAFLLDGLPAGEYQLNISARGHLVESSKRPEVVVRVGEITAGVIIELPRGASIIGRVVGPNGEAIEGEGQAIAQLMRGQPRPDGGQWGSGMLEPDGSFEIGGLREGVAYRVQVQHPKLGNGTRNDVRPGPDPIRIELAARATLEGRVTFEDSGRPAQAFTVRVRRKEGRSNWSERNFSDPEGTFTWSGLRGGTYDVTAATSDGEVAGVVEGLEIPPGGEPVSVDLVLRAGARIFGAVTTPTGAILTGGFVSAQRLEGGRVTRSTWARLDDQGRYELKGLAPGLWQIVATHRDWTSSARVPMEVVSGDRSTLDLSVSAGATLRVRVTDGNGVPVKGATVTLVTSAGTTQQPNWNRIQQEWREARRSGQNLDWNEFFARRSRTDDDGVLVRDRIPPGTYRVKVSVKGYTPGERDVTLRDGAEGGVAVKLESDDAR